jgi:PIN domain
MEPVIKRIYLDTEPLVASLWPRVSRELDNLIFVASINNTEVFIPEPVEAELQARFVRDLGGFLQQANRGFDNLSQHVLRAGITSEELGLPNRDEVVNRYRESSHIAKTKYTIKSSPVTSRSTEELFQMAAEGRGPFNWEKKGFKDAVISLSVIDHMLATPITSAFVSRDRAFQDGALERFAETLGAPKLQHFSTTNDLETILLKHVKDVLRKKWREDEEKLRAALKQMLPVLKESLNGISFTEYELGIIGTVVGAPSVKSLEITKISTPPPWDRKDGERLSVSFDADIVLETVVMTSLTFPVRTITIGEPGSMQVTGSPEFTQRDLKASVHFEASAIFDGTMYKEIQVISALPASQRTMASMLNALQP